MYGNEKKFIVRNIKSVKLHKLFFYNYLVDPIPVSKDLIQLFIYNLDSSTTYKQLKFHFSLVETVHSIFIPVSRRKNRGFAFVTM